ncbi:glycosyltransferase [Acetobacter vaccinii]|nr:glycosyltransferase [Acetobacter vaccinii]
MLSGGQQDWTVFDAAWYFKRYQDVLTVLGVAGPQDCEAFYTAHGTVLRHSPNPYFDEDWYLTRYPHVASAVVAGLHASGFDHYCTTGLLTHNPHWLFDEQFYARPLAGQASGGHHDYRNGYDHYLRVGDGQCLAGSWFFDPTLALASGVERQGQLGPYSAYVSMVAPQRQAGSPLSVYFDPAWYVQAYPDVAQQIAGGVWRCALHHYLANETPTHYNPNAIFSEAFYASVNCDVAEALADGRFRNAYEHFLTFGLKELRRPSASVDLEAYSHHTSVRQDLEQGGCRDIFAHYVLHGGKPTQDHTFLQESEGVARALYQEMCRIKAPLILADRLDFSTGSPDLSVIMVAHNLFAMTLVALSSLRANYAGGIQVILVDSGSTDGIRQIEKYVRGLDIVRFDGNIGFLLGCNAALEKVSSPITLYLNNDTELLPGAIANMLARFQSEPGTGAVGGKLIRTNGLLQEAGSIVWRDGSVQGYLRDQHPGVPEANFVRSVDYCAGAFLAVRTDALRQLGGFDTRYAPAYFEDTDLCLRVHAMGLDVVYDPAIVIMHYEYGTSGLISGASMIARNQVLFRTTHAAYLRSKSLKNDRMTIRARSCAGVRGHILFVEDRMPCRFLGAGFARSNDIVHAMVELGYQVTIYPVFISDDTRDEVCRAFPDRVEIMHGRDMAGLEEFLKDRAGYYDTLWIARTHNIDRLAPILQNCADTLAGCTIVLDTEAIATPREYARRVLYGQAGEQSEAEALRHELRHLFMVDQLVAVADYEKDVLKESGFQNISVLGHQQRVRGGQPGWAARQDILFLGALHDEQSPNMDSLRWFVAEVLPLLAPLLPEGVRVSICGYVGPDVDLSAFRQNPAITVLGRVDQVGPVYDRHRVFIAPTRYAAGIPFKLHEAAAHGLPSVVTDLLARQVGWTPGQDLLCAAASDPQAFAQCVAQLYNDSAVWHRVRDNARERIQREHSPQDYRTRLAAILAPSGRSSLGGQQVGGFVVDDPAA